MALLSPGSPVSQGAHGQVNRPPAVSLISDEFEHSSTLHAYMRSLTVCVLHVLSPKVARSEFI
jgi:hypothetical protein